MQTFFFAGFECIVYKFKLHNKSCKCTRNRISGRSFECSHPATTKMDYNGKAAAIEVDFLSFFFFGKRSCSPKIVEMF